MTRSLLKSGIQEVTHTVILQKETQSLLELGQDLKPNLAIGLPALEDRHLDQDQAGKVQIAFLNKVHSHHLQLELGK